jgi:hypothetical protein
VHALRNIHSALTPAGLLVDTQPVGPQPRVTINGVEAGSLDMLEWMNTIAAVDSRVAELVEDGLFEIQQEDAVVVTDSFDNGDECLATVATWRDTSVPSCLARRLNAAQAAVTVEQDVRLRLLRSTTPPAKSTSARSRATPSRTSPLRVSLGHLACASVGECPRRRSSRERTAVGRRQVGPASGRRPT